MVQAKFNLKKVKSEFVRGEINKERSHYIVDQSYISDLLELEHLALHTEALKRCKYLFIRYYQSPCETISIRKREFRKIFIELKGEREYRRLLAEKRRELLEQGRVLGDHSGMKIGHADGRRTELADSGMEGEKKMLNGFALTKPKSEFVRNEMSGQIASKRVDGWYINDLLNLEHWILNGESRVTWNGLNIPYFSDDFPSQVQGRRPKQYRKIFIELKGQEAYKKFLAEKKKEHIKTDRRRCEGWAKGWDLNKVKSEFVRNAINRQKSSDSGNWTYVDDLLNLEHWILTRDCSRKYTGGPTRYESSPPSRVMARRKNEFREIFVELRGEKEYEKMLVKEREAEIK